MEPSAGHAGHTSSDNNIVKTSERRSAMLSEGLKGRDSLKLSFNRSISEPGHSVPMISMLSPPSVAPSLHPPKRCKIDRSKVGYLTPNAGGQY